MIRLAVSLVAAALLANAASAQPGTAPPAAKAEAPPTGGAPPGKVVSGVVVPAKPAKCGARDKACIQAVVAQLWQLYPEQLKDWCRDQNAGAIRQNILNGQVMGTDTHPVMGGLSAPPEITRVACFKPKAPAMPTSNPSAR